jgi:hypothetical protein
MKNNNEQEVARAGSTLGLQNMQKSNQYFNQNLK